MTHAAQLLIQPCLVQYAYPAQFRLSMLLSSSTLCPCNFAHNHRLVQGAQITVGMSESKIIATHAPLHQQLLVGPSSVTIGCTIFKGLHNELVTLIHSEEIRQVVGLR